MPRDKSASHVKVIEAAREEFLDKGFEKASIRDIAAHAGLTSAGLYRHCKDKEDLFCQVVQPAVDEIDRWLKNHIESEYSLADRGDHDLLARQSEVDLIREVGIPYREEFQLLIKKSAGTRYENFIHNLVEIHEGKMREGFQYLKERGYPVKSVAPEEVHILISAYITALWEPIVHDCAVEDIRHYLDTVEAFFLPGWRQIWGI